MRERASGENEYLGRCGGGSHVMYKATARMLSDLIFCTQYARKHRVAEQSEVCEGVEGPFLFTFSPKPRCTSAGRAGPRAPRALACCLHRLGLLTTPAPGACRWQAVLCRPAGSNRRPVPVPGPAPRCLLRCAGGQRHFTSCRRTCYRLSLIFATTIFVRAEVGRRGCHGCIWSGDRSESLGSSGTA